MIPLVNPATPRPASQLSRPWIADGIRWAVVVLAAIATALAAYLAWKGIQHQGVYGCAGSETVDCDLVLQSRWSQWFGVPVGVFGLLCYASILTSGSLASTRKPEAARWIGTLLAMMTLVAAVSGVWFMSLQAFSVGKFCLYCIGVHLCGLVMAGLVWSQAMGQQRRMASSQSFGAPSAAMSSGGQRRTVAPRVTSGPSLPLAAAGAATLMAILIGGQLVHAPATYKVAKVELAEPVSFSGSSPSNSSHDNSNSAPSGSTAADTHADTDITPPSEPTGTEPAAGEEHATDPSAAETSAAKSSIGDRPKSGLAAKSAPPEIPPPAGKREVKFLNGKLTVDTYTEAVLGSPEAPFVIVEMVDYTCPHCRAMAKNMQLAQDRYGDQLAIVVMPTPLELECNKKLPKTDPIHRGSCKMARLALSVAVLSNSAFRDFHDFLFADKDNPPTVSKAVLRAFKLVDRDQLSSLTNSDVIKDRVQKYIDFFAAIATQQGTPDKPLGLPIQIVGDTVLSGDIDDPDDMFKAWEKAIDIKPQ